MIFIIKNFYCWSDAYLKNPNLQWNLKFYRKRYTEKSFAPFGHGALLPIDATIPQNEPRQIIQPINENFKNAIDEIKNNITSLINTIKNKNEINKFLSQKINIKNAKDKTGIEILNDSKKSKKYNTDNIKILLYLFFINNKYIDHDRILKIKFDDYLYYYNLLTKEESYFGVNRASQPNLRMTFKINNNKLSVKFNFFTNSLEKVKNGVYINEGSKNVLIYEPIPENNNNQEAPTDIKTEDIAFFCKYCKIYEELKSLNISADKQGRFYIKNNHNLNINLEILIKEIFENIS